MLIEEVQINQHAEEGTAFLNNSQHLGWDTINTQPFFCGIRGLTEAASQYLKSGQGAFLSKTIFLTFL